MELELVSTTAAPEQRASWRNWLMATATVRKIVRVLPAWWKAAKAAASRLSKAVRAACLPLTATSL